MILGGYFFQVCLLGVQTLLLNWAIILTGVAVLVGIFNLISVHADKVRRGEKGGVYSALLVISLIVTFFLGIILRPEHSAMKAVMNGIIIPTEAALMGILTISLLYAAIRLLRRRVDVMSIFFLLTAVFHPFWFGHPAFWRYSPAWYFCALGDSGMGAWRNARYFDRCCAGCAYHWFACIVWRRPSLRW